MAYKVEWQDKKLTIVLDKVIGDTADFQTIKWEDADSIVVDFKNVTEFSSNIISKWVKFVSAIHKSVIYRNCPNLIVDFICTISDFITFDTKIESFEVVEHCDKCGVDHHRFVKLDELKNPDGSFIDLRTKCDKCKAINTLPEAFDKRLQVLFQIGR